MSPQKDADVQVFLDERRVVMEDNGAVTQTYHLIYRVDTPRGVEGWSSTGAQYSPWYESRPQVRARVITPDGVEHLLDPKTLTDAPANEDQSDVYDNDRAYHGPLPAIRVGAVVEEEEVIRGTKPFFEGGVTYRMRFGRRVPVGFTRLLVDLPSGHPFSNSLRLLPSASVKKEDTNGRLRFVVENGPLPAQEEIEPNLPGDVAPFSEVEFSTAASWPAVAGLYAEVIEPKIRTNDVKALVDRTLHRGDAPEKTIANLVAVLHSEVRYTGVEYDEASIIPQFPSETLKRKYGDCKDKATLLVAMLRAAGIAAHLALLSTGPGQDVAPDLPGLGMFDHAIVYVPGPPEMWIDATAEFSRVSDLPSADRGRLALIVRPGGGGLVKTPDASPENNLVVETREFFLADNGPARIVETTEPHGSAESGYRSSYEGPDKDETRKDLEGYVKNAYLAEALAKYDHSDVHDFSRPFDLRLEVARGKRGFTDLDTAVAAIRLEGIVSRLPDYLREEPQEEKPEGEGKDGGKSEKTRTADFVFDPLVTEWRYRITPPPGFRLHGLPENQTRPIGPAMLSTQYAESGDGTVTATLRFDTVRGRYTPQEVTDLRKGIRELEKAPPIVIGFDQIGHVLLASGKSREGLRAYEELAATYPKGAIYRVQIARALLTVGLAESARVEATEATKLDPTSALAFKTLGWILQHDLVGRRFKRGFDLSGALAAYRKAKELDAKDQDLRGDLAILLEEDAAGVRYSPTSKLDEAIAEYRELKKIQKGESTLDDNLLYALMYAHRFPELKAEAAGLPPTPTRLALRLAATAASQGSAAAIEESSKLTSEQASRDTALVTAATLLLRIRSYPEAADLLSAGAQGQNNSAALLQQIEIYRKTRHHEEIALPASDPRGVVQQLFIYFFTTPHIEAGVFKFFSQAALEDSDRDKTLRVLRGQMGGMRVLLEKSGLPADVLTDIVVSNLKFSVDGDDTLGYKITLQAVGAANQTIYVVKESGGFSIVGFSVDPGELGKEALIRLSRNDLPAARHWLDWARDEQHLSGGDDPFAGPIFPRFWTKGLEGDAQQASWAAAALVSGTDSARKAIPMLQAGRGAATADSEKPKFDLALAAAFEKTEDWNSLLEVAQRLLADAPDSDTAFQYLASAYRGLKQWDEWQTAAQQRLKRLPDDMSTVRSLALRGALLGQFEEVRKMIHPYVENGKATASDLNLYAWYALFGDTVDRESIEAAQRASALKQNKDFAILHTLACIYAEIGKASEARQLLLQAMDEGGLEEPNGPVWYGFGRIAEEYGEYQAAAAIYSRVEKPAPLEPEPSSSYALAQMRLKKLPKPATR